MEEIQEFRNKNPEKTFLLTDEEIVELINKVETKEPEIPATIYFTSYEQNYRNCAYDREGKYNIGSPTLQLNFICFCGAEHSVKIQGNFPKKIRCSMCNCEVTKEQIERQFNADYNK